MRYIVQGELDTVLHGGISSVIIQLVCKDKKEADKVKEDRLGRYKKLQIFKYSELYPEGDE